MHMIFTIISHLPVWSGGISYSDIWFFKTASLRIILWEFAQSTDNILCAIHTSSMQKHPQYFMHFERQLYTSCIDLCMRRKTGSIIQYRLFDGFSPKVSGPFGFPSLTLLQPFPASTDPHDINSVANWTASVSVCESLRCMSASNGVECSASSAHPLASARHGWSHAETFWEISPSIVCVSEDSAAEMGDSQITSYLMKLI